MIFTKTYIGYSHIKSGKPCQDFSASYHDETRSIITVCDGHGGDQYIRSGKGSMFASKALMDVLSDIDQKGIARLKNMSSFDKIKLNLLCEWNRLVEKDLNDNPIKKKELSSLDSDKVHRLKVNPVKAYGTTMIGAMSIGNKIIAVQIGDGGAFFIKKNKIMPIFEEDDDEPVANITYSLCEEDAFEHIKVGVFDQGKIDGVLISSDGVINPYMSYSNFEKNFVRQAVDSMRSGKMSELASFIVDMGKSKGNGDDVSLAIYLKDRALRCVSSDKRDIKKRNTDQKIVAKNKISPANSDKLAKKSSFDDKNAKPSIGQNDDIKVVKSTNIGKEKAKKSCIDEEKLKRILKEQDLFDIDIDISEDKTRK